MNRIGVGLGFLAVIAASSATLGSPLLEPFEEPGHEIAFADFDGDRMADLAVRDLSSGDVRVFLNTSKTLSAAPCWTSKGIAPAPDKWDCVFADVNGDGRADLVRVSRTSAQILVHYCAANGFHAKPDLTFINPGKSGDGWYCLFGDVNGDKHADMINVDGSTGDAYVYLNRAGHFSGTPDFVAQSLIPTKRLSDGWRPMIADYNGDGKADLAVFCPDDAHFYYFRSTGRSFFPKYSAELAGPREVFEYEYFLADMNGDLKADIVQHNLRTGDVQVFLQYLTPDGRPYLAQTSSMAFTCEPYARPYRGYGLPEEGTRSLNAMMWYGTNWAPDHGHHPDNGWPPPNPNEPNTVPKESLYDNQFAGIYRTATPLLGTYDSRDPAVIRQHAYWLRAAGIDAIVIDWTNNSPVKLEKDAVTYSRTVRQATDAILKTFAGITDFTPPRVLVAMRMMGENTEHAGMIADELYALYNKYPKRLWFTFDDGTAAKGKPMLIVFNDFVFAYGGKWENGPHWVDDRFNCRFSNGYFLWCDGAFQRHLTTVESDDLSYITNDNPYWMFCENTENPAKGKGYYKQLYRRLPYKGSYIPEQAAVWSGTFLGESDGVSKWEGQLDLVDGKTFMQRHSEPLLGKPPRNVLFCNWNYFCGWRAAPAEGLSYNYSSTVEPCDRGFDMFNKTARTVFEFKKLRKTPPGRPVVADYTGATFGFISANYPTEYRVSFRSGSGASWHWYNINSPVVELPFGLRGKEFYLTTRNPFGESETTYFRPPYIKEKQ